MESIDEEQEPVETGEQINAATDVQSNLQYNDLSPRLQEIFDIVCDHVSSDWMALAGMLGVSRYDVIKEKSCRTDAHAHCMTCLLLWKQVVPFGERKALHDLVRALQDMRYGRVADIVRGLSEDNTPLDEMLKNYNHVEIRLRLCLYHVTDAAFTQWRPLSRSLGLTAAEVQEIENRFPGRMREKSMVALYRWRSLVPLRAYKVSSLIRALHACGLNRVADDIKRIYATGRLPPKKPRQKGELELFLSCKTLELSTSGDVTSRNPRQLMNALPKLEVEEYALNKMYFRFLDALDLQDRIFLHPVVDYFREKFGAVLTRASRSERSLSINVPSREKLDEIWEVYKKAEMASEVSWCLVGHDVLCEVGLSSMELEVTISENSYMKCKNELES